MCYFCCYCGSCCCKYNFILSYTSVVYTLFTQMWKVAIKTLHVACHKMLQVAVSVRRASCMWKLTDLTSGQNGSQLIYVCCAISVVFSKIRRQHTLAYKRAKCKYFKCTHVWYSCLCACKCKLFHLKKLTHLKQWQLKLNSDTISMQHTEHISTCIHHMPFSYFNYLAVWRLLHCLRYNSIKLTKITSKYAHMHTHIHTYVLSCLHVISSFHV